MTARSPGWRNSSALGSARGAEAEAAARRVLAAAERLGLAEETCQALEVLGRIARNRDLSEAARAEDFTAVRWQHAKMPSDNLTCAFSA